MDSRVTPSCCLIYHTSTCAPTFQPDPPHDRKHQVSYTVGVTGSTETPYIGVGKLHVFGMECVYR